MSNLENDEKVVETEVVAEQSNEGVAVKENFFERKFQLRKKGTNLKTEVVAGLTTFMAMVYILMVNAGMFA